MIIINNNNNNNNNKNNNRMECLDFFGTGCQFIKVEENFSNAIQLLHLDINFEIINATICFLLSVGFSFLSFNS